MEEKQKSLREMVIDCMTKVPLERQALISLLGNIPQGTDNNDIVYGILMELEIVIGVLEHINRQRQLGENHLFNKLSEQMEKQHKQIIELVLKHQIQCKSRFQRLFSLHRERWFFRMTIVASLTLLSVFSGLGVFYLYQLIFG